MFFPDKVLKRHVVHIRLLERLQVRANTLLLAKSNSGASSAANSAEGRLKKSDLEFDKFEASDKTGMCLGVGFGVDSLSSISVSSAEDNSLLALGISVTRDS